MRILHRTFADRQLRRSLLNALTRELPTWSPVVVPWRLLVVVTRPVTPVVPSPKVTASTLVVAPSGSAGRCSADE
jgi:hypothetical protein